MLLRFGDLPHQGPNLIVYHGRNRLLKRLVLSTVIAEWLGIQPPLYPI